MTTNLQFPTLDSLRKYAEKVNNFHIGEIIYLTDEEKVVMFNGTDFVDVPTDAKIEGNGLNMTLYELNKSIISQLPVKTTPAEQKPSRDVIDNFFKKHNCKHYMLLCKDISYYTIFQYSSDNRMTDFDTLGHAVLDCLLDVGKLVCADLLEDDSAIEIWVRTSEDENLCMYLFECEKLIVTFGR